MPSFFPLGYKHFYLKSMTTSFGGFMNSKKIPKKFINSYQGHVWRWQQYLNGILWRLRPMPVMSSFFWSLVWSSVNRCKQQGFQDTIFQARFHEFIKRYKYPKVFNMWSSRIFVMFSIWNSYVCRPVVANKTVFVFYTCSIDRWDQVTLFPNWMSKSGSFTRNLMCIRITVWFFDTGRPRGTLALTTAERKNTFSAENKDASSLACFTEAIAKWQPTCFFRRLFWSWEHLTRTVLTCRFASRCLVFFGSNLKIIEFWRWMQRKNP